MKLRFAKTKQEIMRMSDKRPVLTVDCVVIANEELLLIKRKKDPFEGYWALPGGLMEVGETAEAAAVRELFEETSLDIAQDSLKLIGVFSNPCRDPRGHLVSIAFQSRLRKKQEVVGMNDAIDARWHPLSELPDIAFDHSEIVELAVRGSPS